MLPVCGGRLDSRIDVTANLVPSLRSWSCTSFWESVDTHRPTAAKGFCPAAHFYTSSSSLGNRESCWKNSRHSRHSCNRSGGMGCRSLALARRRGVASSSCTEQKGRPTKACLLHCCDLWVVLVHRLVMFGSPWSVDTIPSLLKRLPQPRTAGPRPSLLPGTLPVQAPVPGRHCRSSAPGTGLRSS